MQLANNLQQSPNRFGTIVIPEHPMKIGSWQALLIDSAIMRGNCLNIPRLEELAAFIAIQRMHNHLRLDGDDLDSIRLALDCNWRQFSACLGINSHTLKRWRNKENITLAHHDKYIRLMCCIKLGAIYNLQYHPIKLSQMTIRRKRLDEAPEVYKAKFYSPKELSLNTTLARNSGYVWGNP